MVNMFPSDLAVRDELQNLVLSELMMENPLYRKGKQIEAALFGMDHERNAVLRDTFLSLDANGDGVLDTTEMKVEIVNAINKL